MSLQHLKELGEQIIKAAESSPLQTEIAVVSLESIHNLIVSSDQNVGITDMRSQTFQGNNIFEQGQMVYQHQMQPAPSLLQPSTMNEYNFDEQIQQPAVIAPQYGTDVMSQVNKVPFLFHQRDD